MVLASAPEAWFTLFGYGVRSHDLWIVATGAACSVACGLVGCFLVLRRMSLLGDAISHAILPGLAVAFMVTQSRAPMAMLAGALVVGILTAVLSQGLSRWGKVPEDSAMGVVFTALFAVGVVLVTLVARDVDLDPGCVLYGLIEFAPFDTVRIGGVELPRSFVWLAVILLVNAGLIGLFFKELKIVCFDPFLATTMGISAGVVHYGLMTAVAATCVASFEAVGSILVVAMLVAPGATAHLLTDRLGRMLWISAGVAAASAVLGYGFAVWLNTSVAGMISTVASGLFVGAALFAPRHGWVARQVRRGALSLRIVEEDVLGLLYRWHERAYSGQYAALKLDEVMKAVQAPVLGRAAVLRLRRRGLVRVSDDSLIPTQSGLAAAQQVVRGHRLWESYLAKHLGVAADRLHSTAHRAEHYLSASIQENLGAHVEGDRDPHGKPIPPRR